MSDEKRFFFVLGMPRARTAWLSVALTHGDCVCLHEGLADCATFEEYAAKLRAVDSDVVGDCDAAIAYWLPDILREFPAAQFAVITRDSKDAMWSLQNAEPDFAEEIAGWWTGYMEKFTEAAALIPGAVTLDQSQFDRDNLYALRFHLCGFVGDGYGSHIERLMGMRITTMRESIACVPRPKQEAIPVPHEWLASKGMDSPGLSVRYYDPSDHVEISQWWEARHGSPMPRQTLPPLGVVVMDAAGDNVAALWCYESYGVGLAHLEWPITAPGLPLSQSGKVMAFAVAACIYLAGKRCSPPGEYRSFTVSTFPGIARFLKRLGFVAEVTPRIAMNLNIN